MVQLDNYDIFCIAGDFLESRKEETLLEQNHIPPAQTNTSIHKTEQSDWGDIELSRILKSDMLKPKALLCGHMHYPTKSIDKIRDTIIYNAGVDKQKDIPNYHSIEI